MKHNILKYIAHALYYVVGFSFFSFTSFTAHYVRDWSENYIIAAGEASRYGRVVVGWDKLYTFYGGIMAISAFVSFIYFLIGVRFLKTNIILSALLILLPVIVGIILVL